ncbi:MAG: 3-hydroxyacyl-CoA dehydrogenase family protein [Lachnospiraceae bacterium]|nr:3-hydroxyacyl-CoA dehydrogenase family protein [Lachnospiraceae bacterium]
MENIQNVFIAGAGVMGSSMAQLFAKCGYQVTLYDVSEQALVKSRELMEVNLGAAVETGRMSPETAQKIRAGIGYTQDPQDFARADYVVEAIIENMEIKKKFWSQISAIVKETAILTSNTSGLSLTEMAEAVRLPGRFCGMHWLNPPHICPLIEVIRAKETDEETMETVRAMALDIRHFPVTLNREVPGFLVNRFQFAILREAMSLVESGVASMEDIDNVFKYGLGLRYACLGPFEIADLGGLDTFYKIASYLFADLSDTGEVHALLADHYNNGEFGVKSGKGYYEYADGRDKEMIAYRDKMFLKVSDCLYGDLNQ